jgi:hypothetical protein
MTDPTIARRDFLKNSAVALACGAVLTAHPTAGQSAAPPRAAPANQDKLIGIQVGAVSFIDEGVDKVLDVFKQNHINTIFLATFTYGRGIAGRQVPGHPFPDHGVQESDEKTFHGGNYATPHENLYATKFIKPKDTRAPDFPDIDILEKVLPAAKKRNMKVYCWYEDAFAKDIPGIDQLQEIDLTGKKHDTLCPLHPDYRAFLTGLTTDYSTSYDIDGVMWGSERQGPLHRAIGAGHGKPADPLSVTCFCDLHKKAAESRGINVTRAIEGYQRFAGFVRDARAKKRPPDGYFVTFWRLLLDYPELLAWEKLWTDSKHAIYSNIYKAAKAAKPEVQVGFHIWHANSFTPFFRAEQDYAQFARTADYLKIVLYNNCGGPRYAGAINNVANTIFADLTPDETLELHNRWLNYEGEQSLAELPKSGLSSDYVARETKRALADVAGTSCKIYPGIDIDIPTNPDEKQTTPEDVFASTTAALKAGAQGVILSRKYSEMKLTNLAAAGNAAIG